MTNDNQSFANFAVSLLGRPYMYGNNGHIITAALIEAKRQQYPDHYADLQSDVKRYGMTKVQYLQTKIGQPGYDCSTIADLFTGQDKSANGWLAAAVNSGPIATLPELPGITVHYSGHMGVYIGSGYVVEARGTFYGVIKTKLSERPWHSWAMLPGIEYLEGITMLKRGDENSQVYDWQSALMITGYRMIGNDGIEYFADRKFGPATENGTKEFQKQNSIQITGQVDFITGITMIRILTKKYLDSQTAANDAAAKLQLISSIING